MKKESEEFALVYEDGDPVRGDMVRSLLEAAGIESYVKNAGVQNLFALGSLGGINPLIGTIKVYVRNEDRESAEEVLSQAGNTDPPASEPEPGDTVTDIREAQKSKGILTRLRNWLLGE